MQALYGRFRDLIHEAARFGVVGLAGLVVTGIGANLLQYGAGTDTFSATAAATIVATAVSFAASRYWTFRHRNRSGARRETVLFYLVNAIGAAIPEGRAWLASALGLTGKVSYNVAPNGGIALATLFRWAYEKLPVGEVAKFGVAGALALLAADRGAGAALVIGAGLGAFPFWCCREWARPKRAITLK